MTFEMRERLCGACFVRLPYFTGAGDRKEAAMADRMNAFYESLYDAAVQYVQSGDFPAGGRYRAMGECRECGAGQGEKESGERGAEYAVRVRLTLKMRGRIAAEKVLEHYWQGGVIASGGARRQAKNRRDKDGKIT